MDERAKLEFEFMIDEFFLISNLSFRKYIGAIPSLSLIDIHNEIAQQYKIDKIDPDKLEYIKFEEENGINLKIKKKLK